MNELYLTPSNSPKTASNTSESETVSSINETVARHLFENGTISLGKAGEIMGLSKQEMLHRLSIRRIPINYTTDDLNSDLETLDRVSG